MLDCRSVSLREELSMLPAAHMEAQCTYFIQVILWLSALSEFVYCLDILCKRFLHSARQTSKYPVSPHEETDPLLQALSSFFLFKKKNGTGAKFKPYNEQNS